MLRFNKDTKSFEHYHRADCQDFLDEMLDEELPSIPEEEELRTYSGDTEPEEHDDSWVNEEELGPDIMKKLDDAINDPNGKFGKATYEECSQYLVDKYKQV